MADETTPLLDNQSHRLARTRLLIVVAALALIQFLSFLDQAAISTSLAAVASALDTGASTSLVTASFLITSTSIQLINGRLSDIFGRKASLTTALSVMSLGNLLSGLARHRYQLFAARALAGLGAGAINALVQIAIADITTLEQRGYYFSIVGIAVALGNGLGPVVGGFLTQSLGWQWAFWFVCPICVVAVAYLVAVWPVPRPSSAAVVSSNRDDDYRRDTWRKLKLVDWAGACTSFLGIALLLIPTSQGGSAVAWTSPQTLTMILTGALLLTLFLFIELRWAALPLLPARLFQYTRSTNVLIAANICIGWIFWGNLFVLPLYLQVVRGASPAEAGILMLPMVVAHGLTSAGTGFAISRLGRYKPIILAGAVCWALAAVEKAYFDMGTPVWKIVVVGVFDGIGVGCSLQPVLVGLFAGLDVKDRAVMTGLRNFVRDMGGATGTTVSGAILINMLFKQLKSRFSPGLIAKLTSSAFALKDLSLSAGERMVIVEAYMHGLRAIFASFAVIIAIHLCACASLRDFGLKEAAKKQQDLVDED